MKTKVRRVVAQSRRIRDCVICLLVAGSALSASAQSLNSGPPVKLPGLSDAAQITRDMNGIAHIQAGNAHDLYFLQGYVHAQDRLFQMDVFRRLGSGTLAELLGEAALPTDVQLRTIGLRRAAERSLAVLSDRTRAALQAYAEGVGAWVAANPLPVEYGALELTQFIPWTSVDSVTVAKLIAFDRSFDLDIEPTIRLLTYQQAGQALGFDGAALYFEDLFRSAPFDPAVTVLDATMLPNTRVAEPAPNYSHRVGQNARLNQATVDLCRRYLREIKDLPVFEGILQREKRPASNMWGVSGALTTSGRPLLANDPHLVLSVPSTLYPIHLNAGPVNTIGSSFAGVPFVILGHNQHISWGGTVNYLDVTDTFQEQIAADPNSPSGLSIVHNGQLEPIIPIPQVFRKNNFDGVPESNFSVAARLPSR